MTIEEELRRGIKNLQLRELKKDLKDLDDKRTTMFMEGKISKDDYTEVGVLIRKLYKLFLGVEA